MHLGTKRLICYICVIWYVILTESETRKSSINLLSSVVVMRMAPIERTLSSAQQQYIEGYSRYVQAKIAQNVYEGFKR